VRKTQRCNVWAEHPMCEIDDVLTSSGGHVCVSVCVDKHFYQMACLHPLIPAFIPALCHATPVRNNNQHNTRGYESVRISLTHGLFRKRCRFSQNWNIHL